MCIVWTQCNIQSKVSVSTRNSYCDHTCKTFLKFIILCLELWNKGKNVHNSQSLKPYIIQELYHTNHVIPQTSINYSLLIVCNFNAYLQTIIQDHGFKKLHHVCKWSQGWVVKFCKHQNCQNEKWSRSFNK